MDSVNQRWKKVSENNDNKNNNATSSISKVTYDLKYSKWHNGIMMDKNDLLYSAYFGHEWGTNTGQSDKTVDLNILANKAQSIKYDKGIRFLSDSKENWTVIFGTLIIRKLRVLQIYGAGEPWEIGGALQNVWLQPASSPFQKRIPLQKVWIGFL